MTTQPSPEAREAPNARSPITRPLRLGLVGCPLDTGNAGVSALGLSALKGLLGLAPAEFTMLDYGEGERTREVRIGAQTASVRMLGYYNSRRYYRPTNFTQMLLASRLGLGAIHPACRTLLGLDALLDISGGDSFADIYGRRRFTDVSLPKLIAMELGIPLVLLPQTYGPYREPSSRETASRIVRAAHQCWARDEHSFEILTGLLGDAFEPDRHRTGVDVAFGLPAAPPTDPALAADVERFATRWPVTVGLNVSGLLYNRPGDDTERYGFRSSYKALIDRLLARLISTPDLGVILVPHVTPTRPMIDDDSAACRAIASSLGSASSERILALPGGLAASELKWCIGKCDWFCGTRMHSTIGALSQGVPTVAIAYSDKTLGVFATAGVADCVVDPRTLDGDQVLEQILVGFDRRGDAADALRRALPRVREQLDAQFSAIIGGLAR